VALSSTDTVVEIGCGVGRMTRRLSELAGTVIAADISSRMLELCRRAVADRDNVECLQLPGDGQLLGIP
jgi:16S rRNA (adenine1518-N6/adenine1519-N6)-dimethyltransferase